MIRVVVTGSECTGKTTLAAALAEHYDAVWVPEFARAFVIARGAAPEYDDVDAIARGQIAGEDDHLGRASRLVVQDTDLLSTITYSRHYFGRCPEWIEPAFEERRAHLYLLCDIDIPWSADGGQRDRGEQREEMHELFRTALTERSLPFVEIQGLGNERKAAALPSIDWLLERT